MVTSRNPLTLAASVSLWLAGVGNRPLWRATRELSELPELASVRGALMGLMDVSSAMLKPALALAAPCRSPRSPGRPEV